MTEPESDPCEWGFTDVLGREWYHAPWSRLIQVTRTQPFLAPGTSCTGPIGLPDGTTHTPLTWDELVPFERQQGGYWLYGTWCDVYGHGKVFVRVRPGAIAADTAR